MFSRAVKLARPLVGRVSQRGMSWKRNLPVRRPWASDSLIPDIFREGQRFPWKDFRDVDRMFGDMLREMERLIPRTYDAYYIRPRDLESVSKSEVAELKYDQNGFELRLDVQQYRPEELNVKLAGNRLSVAGRHEQKQDEHGYVKREFQREVDLPEDVDLESLTSSVSEEGILTIRANVKGTETPPEKQIEIKAEPKAESKHEEQKSE